MEYSNLMQEWKTPLWILEFGNMDFKFYLIFGVINLLAYFMMVYDKLQAKRNAARIPERVLFFLAFFMGALGIYLGMKWPVYHKSAKPSFRLGIPILMILNAVVIFYLSSKIVVSTVSLFSLLSCQLFIYWSLTLSSS